MHPLFTGAFPIISLYAWNVYETPIQDMLLPLAAVLLATSLIWGVIRWKSGDASSSGVAASMLVASFFGFAEIKTHSEGALTYFSGFWVFTEVHIPALIMLSVMALAMVVVLRWAYRRSSHLGRVTSFLNLFSIILVTIPTLAAVSARFRQPTADGRERSMPTLAGKHAWRPDIYFIILDGYARTDVMKNLFGFDNEPFLERLERRGFFVARQSTSNYCQTRLSIASTLNADYLSNLLEPGSQDLLPLSRLIKESMVERLLQSQGYQLVSFATGFEPTDQFNANLYLYPRPSIPEFDRLLLEMTPVPALSLSEHLTDHFSEIRDRTLHVLDKTPSIARMKTPTFTFAHIVCPHPPFVFGENGEDVSPREVVDVHAHFRRLGDTFGTPAYFREGYRKQSMFLTNQVERMIDQILANSPEPPIIILQSDHGSWLRYHPDDLEKTDLRERFGILNCIYVPDHKLEGWNDRMTSVNTFRILLRSLIGARLPDLKERSFFSTFHDPLIFTDVTDRLHSDREKNRTFDYPPEYPALK